MTQLSPLARGLAAGGSLTVVALAGFTATAPQAHADAIGLAYNCKVSDLGNEFQDAWRVDVSADVPTTVEPGQTITAPAVTAKVTPGEDAVQLLRNTNNKTITSGTADAEYTVGGKARTVKLTVGGTPVTIPSAGTPLVTTATGKGQTETAPASGTVRVVVGDFTARLVTDSGFIANIACTLPSSQDGEVARITVKSGGGSTGTPTSTSTSPSPTTSESPTTSPSTSETTTSTGTTPPETSTATTPPETSTATTPPETSTATTPGTSSTSETPSTTATSTSEVPPSSTQPPTGPPVQTDLVGDGGQNAALAGLGVLAAGGAGAGILLARRRTHRD